VSNAAQDPSDRPSAEEVQAAYRAALEREQEARRVAERAAARTAGLQAVTAALSEATTAAAAARAILTEGLAALGASAGTVCLLHADRRELETIGIEGYPDEVLERWRRYALDLALPLPEAIRDGRPVLLGSWEERLARYPDTGTRTVTGNEMALAALPLVVHGRTIGGLGLVFPERRDFGGDELAFLLTLAQQCAQALERARLHEAERQARLEAEAASRAKDDFLAMLSHELRNPLAPVLNAVEVLRLRGGDPGARAWAVEVVGRQARHMARLVDDLLDVARVTRGALELRREAVDLRVVAAEAAEALRPAFDAKRQQIALALPAEPVWLDADPARLEQVLTNLLHNAAKFTPEGGHIALDLDLARDRPEPEARVQVRDDGEGVPAAVLQEIFEPFRQGHPPGGPRQRHGGLGIGLALARHLVGLHGGTIEAASAGPGAGSTFTVRLPLAGSVVQEAGTLPEQEAGTSTVQEAGTSTAVPVQEAGTSTAVPVQEAGTGRRVLLVEDNVDAAEAMAELLHLWGHEVATAADGPSALTEAATFRPAVVLLDIGLPGMDGYQVAHALRAGAGGEGMLLVALTGFGQAQDQEKARAAGIDRHFIKPVDLAALERLLAEGGGGEGA
jgi:signal transduction histidine kinase/ActR/RegA family two-component response regulator